MRASSRGALYYLQSSSCVPTGASSASIAAAHYSAHRTVSVCVCSDIPCTWELSASCTATDSCCTRCSSSLIHIHRTPQSPCSAGCRPAVSLVPLSTCAPRSRPTSAVAPLGSPPTGFRCDDDPLCACVAARCVLARHKLLLSLLLRRVCYPLFSSSGPGGMSERQVRIVAARLDRTVAGSAGHPLV